MHDAALHGIENAIHDLWASDHRTDRDESAGEGFGRADDVRFDVWPMLIAEPFAGATEAGLDFVQN